MQISDENKKKGDRSELETTPKLKTTPNGNQKKGTPSKEGPVDNSEKKHRRNISLTTEDISDDQKVNTDRPLTTR